MVGERSNIHVSGRGCLFSRVHPASWINSSGPFFLWAKYSQGLLTNKPSSGLFGQQATERERERGTQIPLTYLLLSQAKRRGSHRNNIASSVSVRNHFAFVVFWVGLAEAPGSMHAHLSPRPLSFFFPPSTHRRWESRPSETGGRTNGPFVSGF